MDKAKRQVDLVALEIPSVKFKQAVTGARMYGISGTASKEKADALANKLREVMDGREVRISRPQKCAELRISGLDDTATSEEIAEAIARPGGCATEDVKVGVIRCERNGSGSAWVKCPVEVASQISAPNTKIYVGWTVVHVVLLSTRPMRCYKCHETGHTRATCPKEVDRSQLCFRCGQPDHSAAQCENAPHCALCEASGKPADHSVGSKTCGKPVPKRKRSSKKSQVSQESATTAGTETRAAPMEAQ
ncbi:uncharacterized protein LOC121729582 [Aricia agestis]|uniref:uncharacterized protein LOC121729582 n=1 Tax=Aricia agestis TaxID=91739 RepID=UPI001C2039FB|nr:uncharacterized protein LOC121729582 [Aricia agestis]